MTKLHWPFLPAMLIGGVVATVYAVIVGLPVLRMRGQYFAIATLGVAEATRELVSSPQLSRLTAGPTGINLPFFRPEGLSGAAAAQAGSRYFYYVAVGLLVLVVLATWLLTRSSSAIVLWRFARRRRRQDARHQYDVGQSSGLCDVGVLYRPGGRPLCLLADVHLAGRSVQRALHARGDFERGAGRPGTILGPVVGGAIYDAVSTFLTFSKPFGIDLGQFHVTILGLFIVMVIIFLRAALQISLDAASSRWVCSWKT